VLGAAINQEDCEQDGYQNEGGLFHTMRK